LFVTSSNAAWKQNRPLATFSRRTSLPASSLPGFPLRSISGQVVSLPRGGDQEYSDSEDEYETDDEDDPSELTTVAIETAIDLSKKSAKILCKASIIVGKQVTIWSKCFYRALRRAVIAGWEGDDQLQIDLDEDDNDTSYVMVLTQKAYRTLGRMLHAALTPEDDEILDNAQQGDPVLDIKHSLSFLSKLKRLPLTENSESEDTDVQDAEDHTLIRVATQDNEKMPADPQETALPKPKTKKKPVIKEKLVKRNKKSKSSGRKKSSSRTTAHRKKRRAIAVKTVLAFTAVTVTSILFWEQAATQLLPGIMESIRKKLPIEETDAIEPQEEIPIEIPITPSTSRRWPWSKAS